MIFDAINSSKFLFNLESSYGSKLAKVSKDGSVSISKILLLLNPKVWFSIFRSYGSTCSQNIFINKHQMMEKYFNIL